VHPKGLKPAGQFPATLPTKPARKADATSGFDVRGVVWSDAGAVDPVAAAERVASQNTAGV
jgi:hypothetical protein